MQELTKTVVYVYGSVHRWSILIIVQRDATQSILFIILVIFFVQLPPSNVAKLGHFGGR